MVQMITNRSAPCGTIIPTLIYGGVAKAIAWLCEVFQFTERLRAGSADGTVAHARLAIGMGGVMLGAARSDGAEFRPPRPNELSQYLLVRVEDVEAHYAHAIESGARILLPLATHPFGERQYSAADLEGHRWTFSQAVADVKPEDWGATVSEIKGPLAL